MAETPTIINKIRNKNTNLNRKLNSNVSQELIKQKLTQTKYEKPKIIYQDDDPVRLREVRTKLIENGAAYTIRGNKIFECRPKQKKLDVIIATIEQTIKILKENNKVYDNIEDLCKVVLNDLFDGSKKLKYKIIGS